MQETTTLLDEGANGDSVEPNLQVPLARALADYAPATHGILIDAATYEWAKDVKGEADQFAKEGASEDLGAKNKVTHDLINEWASSRGRDPMEDTIIENMRDESSQSYLTSRTSAFSALGRD